ncbi:MAG: hypothetical protein H0X51_02750 [Parachlamydiaceae bacterium]|nr:hypothetical protein [Parachlamydiaceae bacterium]
MKNGLIIGLLLSTNSLFGLQTSRAEEGLNQNEIELVETLIAATTKSLEEQKELKVFLVRYQELQKQYLIRTEDMDLLLQTARAAHRVLAKINETHLTATFEPAFINELTLFSQVAVKRGIPQP